MRDDFAAIGLEQARLAAPRHKRSTPTGIDSLTCGGVKGLCDLGLCVVHGSLSNPDRLAQTSDHAPMTRRRSVHLAHRFPFASAHPSALPRPCCPAQPSTGRARTATPIEADGIAEPEGGEEEELGHRLGRLSRRVPSHHARRRSTQHGIFGRGGGMQMRSRSATVAGMPAALREVTAARIWRRLSGVIA